MIAPRGAARLSGALALGLLLNGCGSSTTMKLHVESTDRTNAGNVLHMMVRAVDAKTASAPESYQDASAKLSPAAQDASVLSTQPIFPGRPAVLTVDRTTDKSLVLYFFFTSPGERWRVPIASPLPSEVSVELGPIQVQRVQVKR